MYSIERIRQTTELHEISIPTDAVYQISRIWRNVTDQVGIIAILPVI